MRPPSLPPHATAPHGALASTASCDPHATAAPHGSPACPQYPMWSSSSSLIAIRSPISTLAGRGAKRSLGVRRACAPPRSHLCCAMPLGYKYGLPMRRIQDIHVLATEALVA